MVRIELSEDIPIFRAPPNIQERIADLLEKHQTLTETEREELLQYEELDDLLSLINRLTRNLMQASPDEARHAGR